MRITSLLGAQYAHPFTSAPYLSCHPACPESRREPLMRRGICFLFSSRQSNHKSCSAPVTHRTLPRNRAAHFHHAPLNNRQPQSRAARLRRKKWLKQFRARIRCNAGPVVDNLHAHRTAASPHRHANFPTVALRFNRIHHQIRDNVRPSLFRSDDNGLTSNVVRCEFQPHIPPFRISPQQRYDLLRNRRNRNSSRAVVSANPWPSVTQQLRQLVAQPIHFANNNFAILAHARRQIAFLEQRLQNSFHRADRIPQIVRNTRRHLPHQRQPLAFAKLALQTQLLPNQTAVIDERRQLLGEKFQRHRCFAHQHRARRTRLQHTNFFAPVFQRKLDAMPQPSRRPQRRPISSAWQRQTRHRQTKFLANPPLRPRKQFLQIAVLRFRLQFNEQSLHPVHSLLKRTVERAPNHPLQRLKENHQNKK